MNASILIIDDEDLFREDLASLLRDEGFRCRTAGNGEEGLYVDSIVVTGNAVDESHIEIPSQAPSFIALEKDTGQLLWSDDSPGNNVMHGQWGSPTYAVIDSEPQILFPGGDGWL